MRMLYILFAFAAVLLLSCSDKEEATPTLASFPAHVVKVEAPEEAQKGESVAVKVYFTVNNGCGAFGRFQEAKDGTTLTIEVYPHYREAFCTQAVTTRETIYTFKPEAIGTYTLKFWTGNEQYITETVVVR